MKNNLLKSLSIGFLVFAITILTALASYLVSYRINAKKTAEALSSAEASALASENLLYSSDIIYADYYLAILEDDAISLYACYQNNREFLYSIDVLVAEISDEEVSNLKKGVILKDKEALASFEEDFSS